jgi:hypothetical protein
MFRAFLDGLAAMVGWRVGETLVKEARREMGRAARDRQGKAKAAFLEELAARARELPGGTPTDAILVVSSSQIEPHAAGLECVACGAERMTLEQHRAETIDGISVRAIDLACRACGSPRVVYFRLNRVN